jgi:N-acetylmuramoyl-L-alanine amidase CwlA
VDTKTLYIDQGHPDRPGTKLNKVTGVIVHWTANEENGANAVANRNYFNRAWKGTQDNAFEINDDANGNPVKFRYASAHLNVDDHQLVECLPWKKGEAEMGYHVGAANYISGICDKLGDTYPNRVTIGLEICVNADGDFKKAYANGVIVIAMILKEHGLGIDSLFRHYDITGKLCPGFFTQDPYASKYFGAGSMAQAMYAKFRSDVQAALSPVPINFKVYQQGQLYKYQFTAQDGAIGCAKQLFMDSQFRDATIYVTTPTGATIYTPFKHAEDFTQAASYKLYQAGKVQSSYFDQAAAIAATKVLYIKTKDASVTLNNPDGTPLYTPSKHPQDFA